MDRWISGILNAAPMSSVLFALCAIVIAATMPSTLHAQDRNPHPPAIESTTQLNPRGADIVEPMDVFRVTHRRGEDPDTTYLGIAKIPDPRRGEDGAITNRDIATGSLIRISGATILNEVGLQRMVGFDPSAYQDLLVFRPGPHDIVTSRQGVSALEQIAGNVIVFDIAELYAAAGINPLTGSVGSPSDVDARVALLRMESTYPRGEAVNLTVSLVPQYRPEQITMIQVVHRDTTILRTPDLSYVLSYPVESPRRVSIIATIETGYGPRFVRTGIPATTRPEFATRGWADTYYIDGTLRFERPTHRWRMHLFGMSSLVGSDLSPVSHHQIALIGDLRFEYGRERYVAIQVGGRMHDKPHQEFDWNSADYDGGLYVGPGRRAIDTRGLETSRLELLIGLRMGENRPIEVYQAGQRSRGLGAELVLHGHRQMWMWRGLEVHIRGNAAAYLIAGRGARDSGFRQHAVDLNAELTLGREFLGMYIFGGGRASTGSERALYPLGEVYTMTDALINPLVGVELRL